MLPGVELPTGDTLAFACTSKDDGIKFSPLLRTEAGVLGLLRSQARIHRRRRKFFSQSGEDGALEYLLAQLPSLDGWCVEFGAWDGTHLSNCYQLIIAHGFSGVMIEADQDRFLSLTKQMSPHSVTCVNARVETHGDSSLDALLSRTDIPESFDVLSIDIDGDDYHVWESLVRYTPKLVIIEINVRDLPGVERINVSGSACVWGISGSSASSMTHLAHRKGYALVAMIGCNLVFCRRGLLKYFHELEPTVNEAFTFEGHGWRELHPKMLARKVFYRVAKTGTRTRK